MTKLTKFFGIAGLVLIGFGIAAETVIVEDFYILVPAQLIIGTLMLFWFLFRGGLQFVGSAAVKRATGFGVGASVYTALFVGILALVNYIAYRNEFLHFDSTEEKIYTLAPQTVKILNNLDKPLTIRAFYIGGTADPAVSELLERLKKQSDKISVSVIDPEKQPTLIEQLGVREAGTLHFELQTDGGKRETKLSREISEEMVVNAILKLTRGAAKTVYFLQGHGEPDFEETTQAGFSFLKDAIRGENLTFKALQLNESGKVPDDAAAVLIVAPRVKLLEAEFAAIDSYLAGGGNALLMFEAKTTDDVRKLAASYGIEVGEDIIVDQVMRMFAGPSLGVQPMISEYGNHPITEELLKSQKGTVYSTASSVRKSGSNDESVVVTELAFTSAESWAEKNLSLIYGDSPEAALETDDIRGPVSLAAASEKEISTAGAESPKKSRVVVIGDRDFAANVNIDQLFNRDFILNSLNWVVGEQESISIRAGTMRRSLQGLTAEQFNKVFLLTVIVLPEVLLLLGFAVWMSRKE